MNLKSMKQVVKDYDDAVAEVKEHEEQMEKVKNTRVDLNKELQATRLQISNAKDDRTRIKEMLAGGKPARVPNETLTKLQAREADIENDIRLLSQTDATETKELEAANEKASTAKVKVLEAFQSQYREELKKALLKLHKDLIEDIGHLQILANSPEVDNAKPWILDGNAFLICGHRAGPQWRFDAGDLWPRPFHGDHEGWLNKQLEAVRGA